MLLIDAIYIHESGGKVLLEYLIHQLLQNKKKIFILFDKRIKAPITYNLTEQQYIFLSPSEKQRRIFYQQNSGRFSSVLCFANVPPPVFVKNLNVFIYFHNLVLLSAWKECKNYSISRKLLIMLKRFYIQWKNQPNYTWLVQSNRMKKAVQSNLHVSDQSIKVLPFFPEVVTTEIPVRNDIQFIYVADGVPQKNHLTLLKAWEYLYEHHGLSPVLHLTLDQRYDTLIQQITSLQKKGIAIVNHGVISKDELNQLYSKCSYLVFPSLAESFGLPLIEAVQHGCGVLASDLPFVTDVIEPSDQFNPLLFNDIANRVAEFMQHSQFVPASLKVTNQVELLIRSIYS
jgi:glycosyltransferase involved in cell wall biosynthesis